MATEDLDQTIVDTIKCLIEREANNRSKPNRIAQEKYEYLTEAIEWEVKRAKDYYESAKADGLIINTAEAEGFLRAMLWVESTVKDINETNDNNEED
jgi:hypothetical protein